MRFKHNPWLSMVALLLLATILALVCTGCTTEAEAATPERFTSEWAGWTGGESQLFIITDTETGAQYLLADGAGFIKLEE